MSHCGAKQRKKEPPKAVRSCSQWHQSRRFHPVELRNLKMASAPSPGNTARVVASAVFRTKLRHLLTYKGIQPAKDGAIRCEKHSPSLFGSSATAVKEEDDECG